MPRIASVSGDEREGIESLGFDSFHRRDNQIFQQAINDTEGRIPELGLGTEKIGSLSVDKLITGTIYSQQITLGIQPNAGDVFINAGKTDFSDTTNGFILGIDDSDGDKIKFSIGDASSGMDWNVTTPNTLTVVGALSVTAGGTVGGFDVGADYVRDVANSFGLASTVTGGDDVRFWAGDTFANRTTAPFRITEAGVLTATSGTVGGWTLNATDIFSSNFKLESDTERLLLGSATAPLTGIGVFLGKDGSDYEFRAGDPAGNYMHWNGSTLDIVTDTLDVSTLDISGVTVTKTATDINVLTAPTVIYWLGRLVADYTGRSGILTKGGRYILSGENVNSWRIFDAIIPYNPFPKNYTSAVTGLSINTDIATPVYDGSTEYVVAAAYGGTALYRYDNDGTNESSITVSGTTLTGVYRLGYNKDDAEVYLQDGTDQASTTIKVFTFAGTTLTYDRTVTLDTAPANAGPFAMFIGSNYVCIEDSTSTNTVDIRRYDKGTGAQVDDLTWGLWSTGQQHSQSMVNIDTNDYYIVTEGDSENNESLRLIRLNPDI